MLINNAETLDSNTCESGYHRNTRLLTRNAANNMHVHYNNVIMSAMESRITSLTIVYWTVYSGHKSKNTSKLRVPGLCEENSPVTGESPAQRANNAENVSIWLRHHVVIPFNEINCTSVKCSTAIPTLLHNSLNNLSPQRTRVDRKPFINYVTKSQT